MSAIVQATCPGCKNLLRIPADWVNQPIRCKHCGLVMLSKTPQTAAAKSTPPRDKTPLPPTRQQAPVAKLAPESFKTAGASHPIAQAVLPTAAVPSAASVQAGPANGSPFTGFDANDDSPTANKSRVRAVGKRSTWWWKGPLIAVSVFFLAVVILGFTWSKLSKLLPAGNQVVQNQDKDHAGLDKDVMPPKDKSKDGPPADGKPDPNKDKTPAPKDKTPDPNKDKTAPPKDKVNDPNKDKTVPPKDKDKSPEPPKDKATDPPKNPAGLLYPRRALIISLHNYLYADSVHAGNPVEGAHNVASLKNKLVNGLHFPLTQIGFLSDVAPKGQAHSPTKAVIEQTLTSFLQDSRSQDRVMVFFIGHAVEIGEESYLVPIEGELDNAANLIPLKWVYQQLEQCKARQKVFVIDVGRSNPSRGSARPGSGPLGPKLDAALKDPPLGVQVWSACSGEQFSYETDASPMGVFLDKMIAALEKGLTNKIQKAEEPLQIDLFNQTIVSLMNAELSPLKLTQVPRITGKEVVEGAPFSKDEPAPPVPTIATGPSAKDNAKIIQSVLDEISLPPIKAGFGSTEDGTIKVEMLPPFDAKTMASYAPAESKLKEEINKVRVTLWAYSNAPEPPALKTAVAEKRAEFGKVTMNLLKDSYRSPGNENEFKKQIGEEERDVGKILSNLIRLRKDSIETDGTDKPGDLRKAEPSKRWQVSYDYVLAHLEAQISFLYEYQAMLGSMRKELPAKEPGHGGWRMSATAAPTGDSDGKKMAKSSAKIYDALAADNGNTPWFVLAKRERMVSLGLEWKSVK